MLAGGVGWDQACAGLENGDGALQSLADVQLRLHGGRAGAGLGQCWAGCEVWEGTLEALWSMVGRGRGEGKGDFAAWEGTGGAPGRRPVHGRVCDTQAQEFYRRQAPSGPQPAQMGTPVPLGSRPTSWKRTLVEGCWSTSAW